MNRLVDLWRGLVRNIVQDVPDHLAVAEFGQPNVDHERAYRLAVANDAADRRRAEFGDEDFVAWMCELVHTEPADIAADYDGLLYAAAWLRLTSMPEPTDLGDK